MAAVWARARAELRSGWRRGVGLALLIGLVGGAAIAAAAGARRTDSALARFNRAQRAADAVHANDGSVFPAFAVGDAAGDISRLPMVEAVARARFTYVLENDGILAAADNVLGRVIDRPKLLHGRLPRPSAADEVAVSFDAAKRHHLHVGSTFPLIDTSIYPAAAQLVNDHPEKQLTLRAVAIVAVPGGLPPFQPGSVGVYGTPALYRFLAANEEVSAIQGHHPVVRTPDSLLLRLRRGQADAPELRRRLQQLAGDVLVDVKTPEFLDANARRSMHLQAQALWLLAGLLTFSGLLVFAQVLSRFITIEGSESADLRALGMTRRQVWAVNMGRIGVLGVAAAVVAVAVAVAASPLTPLGLARTIETSPGLAFDAAALAAGALAVVLVVLALSAYPAWRVAGTLASPQAATERRSAVASGVARAGLPPTVVAGTRMALEPGRGRTAVPVRSTLVGATVGVAALVTTLTFGSSLTHLLATPRLYGVAWDARMTNYGGAGENVDPDLGRDDVFNAAAATPGVASLAAVAVGHSPVAGRDTGLFLQVRGALRPPILAGRFPTGPDDIALGAKTMQRLHVHIGSVIETNGPSGKPLRFRVVGKTVLPADADPRLGEGMVLSHEGQARAVEGTGVPPTADSLLIKFDRGADHGAVIDELQRRAGTKTTDGGVLDVLVPQKPTDLVNFGGVKSLPFVLAGILGVVAVATLAHLLVSAVRRRRRDLAILKTVGFVRRQVTAAVAWQATTLAAIALIVGLPIGVLVGRWLWVWFASQQGVVAEPRVPFSAVVLVVPAAVVVANLVAALPARAAGLTQPALVLRTE